MSTGSLPHGLKPRHASPRGPRPRGLRRAEARFCQADTVETTVAALAEVTQRTLEDDPRHRLYALGKTVVIPFDVAWTTRASADASEEAWVDRHSLAPAAGAVSGVGISGGLSSQRQGEPEDRAVAHIALDTHLPVMEFDDGLTDMESQAKAAGPSGVASRLDAWCAVEWLPHEHVLLHRQPPVPRLGPRRRPAAPPPLDVPRPGGHRPNT